MTPMQTCVLNNLFRSIRNKRHIRKFVYSIMMNNEKPSLDKLIVATR